MSITQAAWFLPVGQLKLLQNDVGELLYVLKGYQIELTSAGRGLLEYARKLTDNFNQAIYKEHRLCVSYF